MDTASNDMNVQCMCASLDRDELLAAFQAEIGAELFEKHFLEFQSAAISDVPVFVDRDQMRQMQDIIAAVEAVASTEVYQQAAIEHAPEIATYRPGAVGVLMGYDFHLGPAGPTLIEINTNAGGAMINAYLAPAQRLCCAAKQTDFGIESYAEDPAAAIVRCFWKDWRRQRASERPQSIAIVDENPERQFFYPEMLLFKKAFEREGVKTMIASPEMLRYYGGSLRFEDETIDMVYNRLTDFYFEKSQSAALKSAYLADDVVVTPHPRAHAMLANKKNLVLLCKESLLREWNVEERQIRTLIDGIPKTFPVDPRKGEEFWSDRKGLFFKPSAGFGSKAAYRGDKVTRRVWSEILENDYVAQAIVPPSARNVLVNGVVQTMKVDIRNYTYDGLTLLSAARLYQGQTTNMRTRGGGFSPAFSIDVSEFSRCSC